MWLIEDCLRLAWRLFPNVAPHQKIAIGLMVKLTCWAAILMAALYGLGLHGWSVLVFFLAIHYQPHDLSALTDIGDIPWLSSHELHEAHYPDYSLRSFQRRMAQFCADQIVEAFSVTITVAKNGSRKDNKVIPKKQPNLYRLTLKGAEIVEHYTGYRVKRPARSRMPSAMFMLHRAGVARLAWHCRNACRAAGLDDPEVIFELDSHPGADKIDSAQDKLALREVFEFDGRKVSVFPDVAQLFRLPGKSSNFCGYGEFDCSTETCETFARKLLPYAILLSPKHRYFRRHFAEADFARVLVVCKSRQRVDNLCQAIVKLPGSGNFRFAVESDLKYFRLSDPIWRDVHGRQRAILATKTKEA